MNLATHTFTLQPCPFCGSEADILGNELGAPYACCTNEDCGARLPSWLTVEKGTSFFEKLKLVVEYWNGRTVAIPDGENFPQMMAEDLNRLNNRAAELEKECQRIIKLDMDRCRAYDEEIDELRRFTLELLKLNRDATQEHYGGCDCRLCSVRAKHFTLIKKLEEPYKPRMEITIPKEGN